MLDELRNLDVNGAITNKADREADRNAYLFSTEESEVLLSALYAFVAVGQKYIAQYTEEETKAPEIQAKIRNDVEEAYKEKAIDKDTALLIANKLNSCTYWSYDLISIELPTMQEMYIVTAPEDKVGTIDASLRDDFQKTERISEKAAIIGLSGTPYTSGTEIISASIICKLFGTNEGIVLPRDRIDAIPSKDTLNIPMSKIWLRQKELAALGELRGINVGKRGSGKVVVTASITGNGNVPVKMNRVHPLVQIAIGNLIERNGNKTPIIVTPAQICRVVLGVDSNTNISDEMIRKVYEATYEQLWMRTDINFEEQLEKHKHIKKQRDYDYDSPTAGKISAPVIMGEVIQVVYNGGETRTAFKIYDVPPLYKYSHIISQIATVPTALLSGDIDKPVKKKAAKGTHTPRRTLDYQAIKVYMITRIELMAHQRDTSDSKAYNSLIKLAEIEEELGGEELTAQNKRTIRTKVEEYLDELKAQKAIKCWIETRGNRGKLEGYTIQLHATKKPSKLKILD